MFRFDGKQGRAEEHLLRMFGEDAEGRRDRHYQCCEVLDHPGSRRDGDPELFGHELVEIFDRSVRLSLSSLILSQLSKTDAVSPSQYNLATETTRGRLAWRPLWSNWQWCSPTGRIFIFLSMSDHETN